jgi:hypothetical protein
VLQLVRLIFDSTRAPRPVPARQARALHELGAEIPFVPELLGELAQTHVELARLLRGVVLAYGRGDVVRCMTALEALDRELRGYLLKLSVQFEPYVRRVLAAEPTGMAQMHKVGQALRDLSLYVHQVVEMHRSGQLQGEGYRRFGQDLEPLVAELNQCLQTQHEGLFPLYRLVADDGVLAARG